MINLKPKRFQVVPVREGNKRVHIIAVKLSNTAIHFWKRYIILAGGVFAGVLVIYLFRHDARLVALAYPAARALELAGEAASEAFDDYVR